MTRAWMGPRTFETQDHPMGQGDHARGGMARGARGCSSPPRRAPSPEPRPPIMLILHLAAAALVTTALMEVTRMMLED